jgi:hypothetical protein
VYITDVNENDYSENEDLFLLNYIEINKTIKLKMGKKSNKTVFISNINGKTIAINK